MPLLSFPCVITRLTERCELLRRRGWIDGDDFRGLAIAAAAKLGVAPEACAYALFSPPVPHAGVFLEVVSPPRSALIGPMSGPAPPIVMPEVGSAAFRAVARAGAGAGDGDGAAPAGGSESCLRLDELLAQIGLGPTGAPLTADRYVVVVKYSGIWDRTDYPGEQAYREPDHRYRDRCELAARARMTHARYEGVHVVRHETPPEQWTAADLDRLLALAYRTLPVFEPRWDEEKRAELMPIAAAAVGSFASITSVPRDRRGDLAAEAWRMEVSRGDYVAFLELPCCPAAVAAAWIDARRRLAARRRPFTARESVFDWLSGAWGSPSNAADVPSWLSGGPIAVREGATCYG